MGKNEPNKVYKETIKNKRKLLLGSNTLVLTFKPVLSEDFKRATNSQLINETKNVSPWKLFEMLIDANKLVVKGLRLHNSLKELQLCGWISPYTLFLSGLLEDIKVVKYSWVKRIMRSPLGFCIKEFGFVQDFYVESIPQSLFLSLATALFETIIDLNQQNIYPNKDALHNYLKKKYSDIVIPDSQSIHDCLSKLVCEKRLYHNGRGYFVFKNDSFSNECTSPNSSVKRIAFNTKCLPEIELDFSQKEGFSQRERKAKLDIELFSKNLLKHKEAQLSDDKHIGIMNFLTRNEILKTKTNQVKTNYTDKNYYSYRTNTSKNGSSCYEPYLLEYIENENLKYRKKKRSNSFHGTDSEKSFEKSVSFAIVGCKNEKTVFKRHYSFGAGSHNILQSSQDFVREETKEIAKGKVIAEVRENTKDIPEVRENTQDIPEVRENTKDTLKVREEIKETALKEENKEIDDVFKSYYDDLGSALSLTNQPIIDVLFTKKNCPFENELSLADEMKVAEEDINLSKCPKYSCNSNELDLNGKRETLVATSLDTFLSPQSSSDSSSTQRSESITVGNLNLATFSDKLEIKGYIKQPSSQPSSNEERKQNQKERNSILFAGKKGTLRVVGFV